MPSTAQKTFRPNTATFDSPEVSFADLGLPPQLVKSLDALGLKHPTPIQTAAIPVLLNGQDLVGIAQTGTGKTAAFGLPMLTRIDSSVYHVQALVLAPTRELALQVQRSIADFAGQDSSVRTLAVYGGAPYAPQERALRAGVHIVVGTPGRIIDHLQRGRLDFSKVRFVVLDEGDEMLRMGFAEEVEQIMDAIPKNRQMALFSATMPAGIRNTVANQLHNPVEIAITPQSSTVATTTQLFAVVPPRHKLSALARVLVTSDTDASLVFVRTRANAEEVCTALVERGIAASVISGDVSQVEREKVVERIRAGQIRTLVATDVAARGLDISRIGLVVNYDLPHDAEAYVHRIGRTGRAGRSGAALSFVGPKELGKLRRIEQHVGVKLAEFTIPTPAEVTAHRVSALLAQIPARIAKGRLDIALNAVGHFISTNRNLDDATQIVAALAAIAVGDTGSWVEKEESESRRDLSDKRPPRKKQPAATVNTKHSRTTSVTHNTDKRFEKHSHKRKSIATTWDAKPRRKH
ncbi:MAG: DEAD/DEAH box helicase [Propionibacteriaceae bacterium]|jgi:ATP-dependent RNA helicase DeaD|nr:DEAD/DEAH box helicase [Propionibacteriaceae bacterium]